MTPLRLLQLLPPTLTRDAAWLAAAARTKVLNSGASQEDIRIHTVRRGVWENYPVLTRPDLAASEVFAAGSAIAACLGVRVPITYTPVGLPKGPERAALRFLARRTPLHAVVTTQVGRRVLEKARIAWASMTVTPIAVPARPVVRNSQLRMALGIAESDWVVLAVGESDRQARHSLAIWAVSILAFTDARWRLLILSHGAQADQLYRFAHDANRSHRLLIQASEVLPKNVEFSDLLPAADYLLDVSHGFTDSLPLLQAVASGVPLVTTPSPLKREVLPPSTFTTATPKLVARGLLDAAEAKGHVAAQDVHPGLRGG